MRFFTTALWASPSVAKWDVQEGQRRYPFLPQSSVSRGAYGERSKWAPRPTISIRCHPFP